VDLDPTRLRVMKLIQERGSDLKNASLAIGRNAAYLHQYVTRGVPKVLPDDVREPLAVFLGVPAAELRHQEPEPAPPPPVEHPPLRRRPKGVLDGYAAIAELDVRASAGAGAMNEGIEEAKATWLFPEAVIRHEFRANPEALRLITIDGDSMEPLLVSGDRIMVDTSQRIPVPPGIFVIWDGMGVVAKRVEHVPNSDPATVVIKSVNPAYQTYERSAEEVHMIGRAIWVAKRL
jgi:hypothetical protein